MAGSRTYKTGQAFRTALEERLAQIALRESVDLQRLRRQVSFDRLLARLACAPGHPWVLKGGYALELRYRKARSTKDLDFTMRFVPADQPAADAVLEAVREAVAVDLSDFFSFLVAKATSDLEGAPYGGARYPVEAVLGGRTFARFHVDIGVGDLVMEPVETIHCRDWLGFAHVAPGTALVILPEQQFAEKLHAYTFPRLQLPNSRVRDLVDMLLLVESRSLSAERTREAVARTFARRGTHPIPPALQPASEDWAKPFSALTVECGLDTDLNLAFKTVDDFYRTLQQEDNFRDEPR